MKGGWPLAVVGSLGYIAGQYPVAVYLGPYLPDVTGAIVCFAALLLLAEGVAAEDRARLRRRAGRCGGGAADAGTRTEPGEVLQAWMPFIVLLIVVAAWTGPWSPLPKVSWFKAQAVACSALAATCPEKGNVTAVFNFAPYIGGTAILASWLIVAVLLLATGDSRARRSARCSAAPSIRCGARCLVGVFIFGLAYIFNYSGMAASLAKGFSKHGHGLHHRRADPRLHRRGAVGLQHLHQRHVRQVPGAGRRAARACRRCCCRRLNSVGAEIGKPIAPQTASVGVSTSKFVRKEGDVIRHNMGWTFILLAYLILIAIGCYLLHPPAMKLP